jgi:guanylate kinase
MPVLPFYHATNTQECPTLGKLIVLTGPSGVGKGTLMNEILQRHPELYEKYYFITRQEFQELVTKGELLEWAEFAGNFYGTPRAAVLDHIQSGKLVLLEIELEGARQIRTTFPSALSIFILPPSFSELENRIRGRGQDSEEAISRRLKRAEAEIAAADEFDLQIINDDFEQALKEIEKAIFE